jgi:hypothetical protein
VFREREAQPVADDEVIEHPHVHQCQCLFEAPRDELVRLAGLENPRWMVAGDSLARSMRLRLRLDDRELLADERDSRITLGRAEDNDLVVKGHLVSRLHARIEISRNSFVLIDQSTNGTFVQTVDGEEAFVRHESLVLKRQGMIGLGRPPELGSPHTIHFTCEEI